MSVQFGRWNFSDQPIDREYLERVKRVISPYGPDWQRSYQSPGIALEFCAFVTTVEAKGETQPMVTPSGMIVMWDGRLDNRAELALALKRDPEEVATDAHLVAAAYEQWRDVSFGRLIGDWAMSIWDPQSRSVTLAKDSIGVRPLYYRMDRNGITWSSVLDPLVVEGNHLQLCEEYLAGWLSFCPPADRTPFVGVNPVPASSFVRFTKNGRVRQRFWNFDPGLRIQYRTDSEYEEHFRAVFSTAVERRLRSDRPVLAELSGGMDSSAIVCLGDRAIARAEAGVSRLNTVSYFNDSEPNWNERPYFEKVEQMRGLVGHHIDVSARDFTIDDDIAAPDLVPGSSWRSAGLSTELKRLMAVQESRVLLSGVGGDEVAGGVPTPLPELENLLWLGQLAGLTRQLKLWSLARKQPWPHLLFETFLRFFPVRGKTAPWLAPGFVRRNRHALLRGDRRVRFCGPLPSFQEALAGLNLLRGRLEFSSIVRGPLCERRYPFLDRDLLVFLYGVPREQLVRPGQRRSLMRRALVGIVPDAILNRKRKAFVSRSLITDVLQAWSITGSMPIDLHDSARSMIDADALRRAVEDLDTGRERRAPLLMRAIELQLWLKKMKGRGFIFDPQTEIPFRRTGSVVRSAPAKFR
jgi:asparagine synthase (glutamine-hydrolysing)